MRCARCGVTSDATDVCPDCGQVVTASLDFDLPSVLDDPTTPIPAGPLAELTLDGQALDAALAPEVGMDPDTAAGAVRSTLPLLPSSGVAPTTASAPSKPTPNRARGQRPLAVRRQTPRVPKLRERATASPMALEFDHPGRSAETDGLAATGNPASLGRRVVAAVIDAAFMGAMNAGVLALTARLAGLPVTGTVELPLLPLASFLVILDVGYVVTLTTLGGQTIGKMAVGIRVVAENGSPATLGAVLMRTAAYVVSVLPAGVGLFGMLTATRRTLHDHLAATQVVKV